MNKPVIYEYDFLFWSWVIPDPPRIVLDLVQSYTFQTNTASLFYGT